MSAIPLLQRAWQDDPEPCDERGEPAIECPYCDCFATWYVCQTNDGLQNALFCDGDCGNVTAAHAERIETIKNEVTE